MTPRVVNHKKRLSRRTLLCTGVFVILAIVATISRYRGLVFPVRIASGSMANALLGPHRSVVCGDCGIVFQCGLDTDAPLGVATCPNCGFGKNELTDQQIVQGEGVLIDRWAYWRQGPRRGDLVAFVDPVDNTQLAVKRVVGLPGERVAIANGDLLINGQLHRKSLAEAKRSAILVYDDSFQHQVLKPDRWRGSRKWRPTRCGFQYTLGSSEEWDWLAYQHWRCYASAGARAIAPIADNYGYNQGVSRELNEVTDVWMSFRIERHENRNLAFSVDDGGQKFQAIMSLEKGTAELFAGDSEVPVSRKKLPTNLNDRSDVGIEFGMVDRQVFLAIDNSMLIWHDYRSDDTARTPIASPLRIGAVDHGTIVQDLKVFRDIYYLGSHGSPAAWEMEGTLGPDEFFVLGDNVPLSIDSRNWKRPGLARNALLGKVLTPPDAAR